MKTIRVYDLVGDVCFDPTEDFRMQLDACREAGIQDIMVEICSIGGYVVHAIAIHDMVRTEIAKGVNMEALLLGPCMSAATVVACAFDTVKALDGLQFMIHNAHVVTGGNKNDLRATVSVLEKNDDHIAKIYERKTGKPAAFWSEQMNANGIHGTTYTIDEAIDMGFVNEKAEMQKAEPAEPVSASMARAMNVRNEKYFIAMAEKQLARHLPKLENYLTNGKINLHNGKNNLHLAKNSEDMANIAEKLLNTLKNAGLTITSAPVAANTAKVKNMVEFQSTDGGTFMVDRVDSLEADMTRHVVFVLRDGEKFLADAGTIVLEGDRTLEVNEYGWVASDSAFPETEDSAPEAAAEPEAQPEAATDAEKEALRTENNALQAKLEAAEKAMAAATVAIEAQMKAAKQPLNTMPAAKSGKKSELESRLTWKTIENLK